MNSTDPFVGMVKKKLTDAELARAIRIDMAAELDAINLYQAHLESTDNPIAQHILQHIMNEEKDHIAEFAELLYHLDPVEAQSVVHAKEEFAEAMQETGVPARPASMPEASGSAAPALTVGSLNEA